MSPLSAAIGLALFVISTVMAQTSGYIENASSITVFDTVTGAITNTFTPEIQGTDAQPAVSYDGSTLYVPGYFALKNALLVMSAQTGAVLNTVALIAAPYLFWYTLS